MLTQRPRGTSDLLPGVVEQWQRLEDEVRKTFRAYNYREVRTPIFEHTELFARGVGETTDIVEKEMYTFADRGDRSLTLRPEGTAGVVRAYVENKWYGQPGLTKLYYAGPMFRYEKPQKGRERQFHQYGVEVLGAQGPAVDAEVIALSLETMTRFGLRDVVAELNSVGCKICRPVHKERMLSALRPVADRLCKDCSKRLERNPLRIFDCKNGCRDLLQEVGAPTVMASLCSDCHEHFDGVKLYLQAMDVPYVINEHLVRGLDYYTRTAWEVTASGFGTLGGGGRYNGLVEDVGGPETPGIGFAVGMERVLLLHQEQAGDPGAEERLDVFVAVADDAAEVAAMTLLRQLRAADLRADRDYQGRSMKSQFKAADRERAGFVAILGSAEVERGTVTVKEMSTGEQVERPVDEAVRYIEQRVKGNE